MTSLSFEVELRAAFVRTEAEVGGDGVEVEVARETVEEQPHRFITTVLFDPRVLQRREEPISILFEQLLELLVREIQFRDREAVGLTEAAIV